eukprot:scaffold227464_cov38-Prasinocladus_malaysianus.AAC.1
MDECAKLGTEVSEGFDRAARVPRPASEPNRRYPRLLLGWAPQATWRSAVFPVSTADDDLPNRADVARLRLRVKATGPVALTVLAVVAGLGSLKSNFGSKGSWGCPGRSGSSDSATAPGSQSSDPAKL